MFQHHGQSTVKKISCGDPQWPNSVLTGAMQEVIIFGVQEPSRNSQRNTNLKDITFIEDFFLEDIPSFVPKLKKKKNSIVA